MNLESIVASTQGSWNDTERDILAYLLAHQAEATESSVQQIAQRTYTSTSSVMRLAKRLGFSGFAEMKYFIRTSLREMEHHQAPDPIALQRDDLLGTLTHLESLSVAPIVSRLYESRAIYCLGTGSSQRLAASEFAKSLMANGKQATVITDLTEMKVSLPMMEASDTLVLISLGGTNPDFVEIPRAASLRGVPTLAVTRLSSNPLAAASRWNIHYCSTALHPSWHVGEYHSLIGLNVALDYVIRAYMAYRLRAESAEG
ncbi:MurR/RpiR family transcriptional regulator [Corynebacterium oculi]|uniref:HTH-type transcriptional regulator GlvR n=1 Tax=Corynebacterium oculi TaxID=1544416 RepID=A0A0Q0YD68_9CORY|nr:MurR/RpiR family transcriptional regulator [Corynebacterium oculi]KQB84231.1 HTH-type transcriptional regulator GlvR [Corynebacterium oculi]